MMLQVEDGVKELEASLLSKTWCPQPGVVTAETGRGDCWNRAWWLLKPGVVTADWVLKPRVVYWTGLQALHVWIFDVYIFLVLGTPENYSF
jgi:hypothetical protein